MISDRANLLGELARQRIELASVAEPFAKEHGEALASYRELINTGVDRAIQELSAQISETSGSDPACRQVAGLAVSYLGWMKWALGDLPYLAVAIRPNRDQLREHVSACTLVYFADRIVDDLVDRHFLYRNQHPTLLASVAEAGICSNSDAATIAMALLLTFEGISRLLSCNSESCTAILRNVIHASRRVVIGLMLEQSGRENWTPEYYERLVELKNVDYWRILYTALDPAFSSPLYPFLCKYYAFAQKLNDVQGYARDVSQGVPNLLTIYGASADDFTQSAEARLGADLLELGELARSLPDPERTVASLKLLESQGEAYRLQLFAKENVEPDQLVEPMHLFWHSQLRDFIERLGPGSVEEISCPVCDGAEFSLLCRAQGFQLNRCSSCGHVYVSPRIRPEIQQRLGNELDTIFQDPFLEIQKLGAEYLCRLLRKHAPGPRLLDIGFGGGYLLRMARAYAFQVYGLDSSESRIAELASLFGHRLKRVHLSGDPLPWGAFDVVVMSHVVEHLPQPARVLNQVRQAMNRRAILYIAVPDIDSLQFRVFGNRWDAINPVAHYQFFNESSLSRLLKECGFEIISRVRHPGIQGVGQARWMKLFRRLGGDESGELAMLARVPGSTYGLNTGA